MLCNLPHIQNFLRVKYTSKNAEYSKISNFIFMWQNYLRCLNTDERIVQLSHFEFNLRSSVRDNILVQLLLRIGTCTIKFVCMIQFVHKPPTPFPTGHIWQFVPLACAKGFGNPWVPSLYVQVESVLSLLSSRNVCKFNY